MENNAREIILFLIALLVPLILLRLKRNRLLLGWVCFTFSVQIFDTVMLTNLPTGRIVGFLYIPYALGEWRKLFKLAPVKAWIANYGVLVILGIFLGFIFPWPDTTYIRPFTLTAPGRTVIYLARLLTDLSLSIFIATEIRRAHSLIWIGKSMVAGSTVSAIAGIFHFITKIDLYFIITGLGEQVLFLGRSRGLVGEPRTLGLSCAYGIMILLIGRQKLSSIWPILILINLAGLLITYSASSLALFALGVIVCLLFFSNRERLVVAGITFLTFTVIFLSSLFTPDQFKYAIDTLSFRLDPDVKLAGIPPGTFGQEIAYRLDVFDACALLFLLDNPLYALIGTGPGLVSLPASEYVPPGLYSLIWTPEQGINSPPYLGPLLEISNSGLVGLGLWLLQVGLCWKALRWINLSYSSRRPAVTTPGLDDWKFGYALFLIGAAFYIVQVSYTPLWSLFLGIGWIAVEIYREGSKEQSIGQAT